MASIDARTRGNPLYRTLEPEYERVIEVPGIGRISAYRRRGWQSAKLVP